MSIFKSLFRYREVKIAVVIAFVLILYGNIARVFGISFFWESLYVGIIILLLSILTYAIRKHKESKKKRYLVTSIFIYLFLFIYLIINIIIFNSKPYSIAKESIRNNQLIIKNIGDVRRFGYVVNGSIETSSNYSYSELKIIVKGSKRISEVYIFLEKKENNDWHISNLKILH